MKEHHVGSWGIKGHVDKSRGMETLMTEVLLKSNQQIPSGEPNRQCEENETDQIPRAILRS